MSTGSAWLLLGLKGSLGRGRNLRGSKEGKRKADAVPELVGVDGCGSCPVKGRTGMEAITREQLLLVTEVLKSSLPLKTELCGL